MRSLNQRHLRKQRVCENTINVKCEKVEQLRNAYFAAVRYSLGDSPVTCLKIRVK